MYKEYRVEIKEAIKACDSVVAILDRAKRSINSAQGLGIVDLIGGKTFVTFLKRTRINKAEKEIAQAKKAIQNLNKELGDVEKITNVDFNIGLVLTLADYFFGGAFADFIVLGRLGDAKRKINNAKLQVLDVRADLQDLLNRA